MEIAKLLVKGKLGFIVQKPESFKENGVVVPAHIQLQFFVKNEKGLDLVKVKDSLSKFSNLKEGQDVEIPVRVTASSMGQTFYEVA